MNVLFTGKFFKAEMRTTSTQKSYMELRCTQKNEKGINTEVFNVFEPVMMNALLSFKEDDVITLDLEVYVKNGYQQKYVNSILDLDTGEKIA